MFQISPDDGREFSDLVDNARSAMQQAKSVVGGKFIRYSEQLLFDVAGGNSLAAELRTAVRKNQFELHYQPRIDLSDGQLVGLEALLRWNHPERGLLYPGEFLCACEDMGLMRTIGYQVIQHACSALIWLGEQGLRHVDVAVNISFSQIQDNRFLDIVRDIVTRSGADASRLEFELTESTILKSPGAIKERMDELRKLGISFSLDDFGTGYSSLSYLKHYPIDKLKIDQSFVHDMTHDPGDAALIVAIIAMGHSLSIPVLAEGVETPEQLAFLTANNCDLGQGFHIGKPMPLEALLHWFSDATRWKSGNAQTQPDMAL